MTVQHIPRREYDGLERVNWSTLKFAVTSGKHYHHCLTAATPETDAMRKGRGLHAAVFEPDVYEAEFVYWEGGRRAGGEWERFKDAHVTKTILRAEDRDDIAGMAEAVRAHPVAGPLLADGEPEVTLTWTDPDTGIDCKARVDFLTASALVELKSTKSIDMRAFGAHAASLLYHGQLAFYQMGLQANDLERATKIIAVESDPPHDAAVFDFDDDQLWAGEVKVRQALETVKACRKERKWPGRYPGEVGFMLPAYAHPTEDETEAAMRGGG